MEKKKESIESQFVISKSEGYKDHRIVLPLDKERTEKFNKGESITVTAKELEAIINPDVLEVKK